MYAMSGKPDDIIQTRVSLDQGTIIEDCRAFEKTDSGRKADVHLAENSELIGKVRRALLPGSMARKPNEATFPAGPSFRVCTAAICED